VLQRSTIDVKRDQPGSWLHLSRRRQPSRVQRMPGYTVEILDLERYYTIGYWILVVHVLGAVCVSWTWCFLVLVCVRVASAYRVWPRVWWGQDLQTLFSTCK